MNDPTGTYAFAYDNMGRLIGTTTTLRLRSVQGYRFLTSGNFTNAYTYDLVECKRAGLPPQLKPTG